MCWFILANLSKIAVVRFPTPLEQFLAACNVVRIRICRPVV